MATENDWFMKQVKGCSRHDWYNFAPTDSEFRFGAV